MFPQAPLFINDDLDIHTISKRNYQRREWLMSQCDGPIVIMAPSLGPNQVYPWAHCYQPVYQDSFLLYLTGVNQTGIALVLDPKRNEHHIFLPEYSENTVFWDGDYFAVNHAKSEEFFKQLNIHHCHSMAELQPFLLERLRLESCCHMMQQRYKRSAIKDEAYRLRQSLKRKLKDKITFHDVSELSWKQRLIHDSTTIECFYTAAQKTANAFANVLSGIPYNSETTLTGHLIGELLKESEFGLGFSPIVAKNENACILHYTNNSSPIQKNDLILMDFGLRWQSICSDVSRTIPAIGKFTDLQKHLMDIVLETQLKTIDMVRPGVSFNELNEFAWSTLDHLLETKFHSRGGTYKRDYKQQPHNIGHFLGIQVHDGDSNRAYRSQALVENNVITIEPGLYGFFELNGESQSLGIRIEDNLRLTATGSENLTHDIPKSWENIENYLNKR